MSNSQQASSLSISSEKNLPPFDKISREPIDDSQDVEKWDETHTAVSTLDWDGPNDPDNPMNWPAWKRHVHVIAPAVMAFSAYVFLPL